MKNQKDISDCQEFNLKCRLKNYERKDDDLALSGKTSCYSSFYHKNSYENPSFVTYEECKEKG